MLCYAITCIIASMFVFMRNCVHTINIQPLKPFSGNLLKEVSDFDGIVEQEVSDQESDVIKTGDSMKENESKSTECVGCSLQRSQNSDHSNTRQSPEADINTNKRELSEMGKLFVNNFLDQYIPGRSERESGNDEQAQSDSEVEQDEDENNSEEDYEVIQDKSRAENVSKVALELLNEDGQQELSTQKECAELCEDEQEVKGKTNKEEENGRPMALVEESLKKSRISQIKSPDDELQMHFYKHLSPTEGVKLKAESDKFVTINLYPEEPKKFPSFGLPNAYDYIALLSNDEKFAEIPAVKLTVVNNENKKEFKSKRETYEPFYVARYRTHAHKRAKNKKVNAFRVVNGDKLKFQNLTYIPVLFFNTVPHFQRKKLYNKHRKRSLNIDSKYMREADMLIKNVNASLQMNLGGPNKYSLTEGGVLINSKYHSFPSIPSTSEDFLTTPKFEIQPGSGIDVWKNEIKPLEQGLVENEISPLETDSNKDVKIINGKIDFSADHENLEKNNLNPLDSISPMKDEDLLNEEDLKGKLGENRKNLIQLLPQNGNLVDDTNIDQKFNSNLNKGLDTNVDQKFNCNLNDGIGSETNENGLADGFFAENISQNSEELVKKVPDVDAGFGSKSVQNRKSDMELTGTKMKTENQFSENLKFEDSLLNVPLSNNLMATQNFDVKPRNGEYFKNQNSLKQDTIPNKINSLTDGLIHNKNIFHENDETASQQDGLFESEIDTGNFHVSEEISLTSNVITPTTKVIGSEIRSYINPQESLSLLDENLLKSEVNPMETVSANQENNNSTSQENRQEINSKFYELPSKVVNPSLENIEQSKKASITALAADSLSENIFDRNGAFSDGISSTKSGLTQDIDRDVVKPVKTFAEGNGQVENVINAKYSGLEKNVMDSKEKDARSNLINLLESIEDLKKSDPNIQKLNNINNEGNTQLMTTCSSEEHLNLSSAIILQKEGVTSSPSASSNTSFEVCHNETVTINSSTVLGTFNNTQSEHKNLQNATVKNETDTYEDDYDIGNILDLLSNVSNTNTVRNMSERNSTTSTASHISMNRTSVPTISDHKSDKTPLIGSVIYETSSLASKSSSTTAGIFNKSKKALLDKLHSLQKDLKLVFEVQNILSGAEKQGEKNKRNKRDVSRSVRALHGHPKWRRRCKSERKKEQNKSTRATLDKAQEVQALGKLLQWKAKTETEECKKAKRFLYNHKQKGKKKKHRRKGHKRKKGTYSWGRKIDSKHFLGDIPQNHL